MSDPVPSQSYRPIEPESGGGRAVLRVLLSFAFVAAAILIVHPEAIRAVARGWSGDPNAVRVAAIAGLLLLALARGIRVQIELGQGRRAALSSFASAVRGTASAAPYRATKSGWKGGPRVDYRVEGVPVSLTLAAARKSSSLRLAAEVGIGRDFQFQILPGGAAARILLSKTVLQPVFSLARGTVGASDSQINAAVLDRMCYMAGDPLTTGDEAFDREFLVKASDGSLGRGLLSDPSFRAALRTLREVERGFRVALECESPSGPGLLVVEAGGACTGERLNAMDQVLRSSLACLMRLEAVTAKAA